jgi:hypothetical protein
MSLPTVFAFLAIVGIPAWLWLRGRRNTVRCASCHRRYDMANYHQVRYVPHLNAWLCSACLTRDPYLPWRRWPR